MRDNVVHFFTENQANTVVNSVMKCVYAFCMFFNLTKQNVLHVTPTTPQKSNGNIRGWGHNTKDTLSTFRCLLQTDIALKVSKCDKKKRLKLQKTVKVSSYISPTTLSARLCQDTAVFFTNVNGTKGLWRIFSPFFLFA